MRSAMGIDRDPTATLQVGPMPPSTPLRRRANPAPSSPRIAVDGICAFVYQSDCPHKQASKERPCDETSEG